MNSLKLAIRNLSRNRRRSATTILTIVVGMIALLLFGGFISSIYFGLQTSIVRSQGHLHIYPQGYLEYGSSRPADYFIDDYKSLISKLNDDEIVKERTDVITPIVRLSGIAGNYAADTSKTFIGTGLIPSDQNQMQRWNYHNLEMKPVNINLTDTDIDQGIVGLGMAKMLNLCKSLSIPDCKDRPVAPSDAVIDDDILSLQLLLEENKSEVRSPGTHIDLLASTGSGAPNAVSLSIIAAQRQPNKVLDDSFVAMHLQQAQNLIFADDSRVSAILVQLTNTGFMEETQTYLEQLLNKINNGEPEYEVKNFTQFNAEFYQVINMFFVIFVFVALVISLVVLFTTINTMTMSVMERFAEIGSLRAMGLRRSAVRWHFLLEGVVIGIAGATLGIIVSIVLAQIFNYSGFSWTPPGNTENIPMKILLFSNSGLMILAWILMVFVVILSSLMPARLAARMNIVDAIRKG